MSSQEDEKDRKEYYNIDDIGNRPKFDIFKQGSTTTETLIADSRINLAISLTKFRLYHLFDDKNIKLTGEIYHKEIFKIFLDFACNGIEEESEELKKYSLYLYVYSDIWGFDDLKETINKLWKNNPEILDISEKNGKNKDFLNDIISYQKRIFRNTYQNSDLSYISPIEFYAQNINIILSESIKTSKFADLPPDYLDIIFQHIKENYQEKLDSKIYFNFLLQYIQRACNKKRKNDLLLCSNLIRYLKLDELNYDDLKKYVNMDFAQKIGSENKSKDIIEEKQIIEKNINESEYRKEVEEEDEEEEEKEEEEGKDDKEEEEQENDNYADYFDFLTFTQFKSFAQKLINENEKTKKKIESLRNDIKALRNEYKKKNAEIQSLMNNKKEELIREANQRLKPLEKLLKNIDQRVKDIEKKNINLEGIHQKVEENTSKYDEFDKKFNSIKENVDNLNYKYQISSYVISAINHQFYSVHKHEQSIYNINYDQKEILCQAELNFDQIQNENINIEDIFKFTLTKDSNDNPTVYFYSDSLLKKNQNQTNILNKNNVLYDIMIKKYDIEIEDTEFQRVLSWKLEGFFPCDYNSYDKNIQDIQEKQDVQDIPENQWFPISVHNIADASEKKSPFDTLFINDNYTNYTCTLGFSPICKCIRLKLIRNSNDDNVLRIKRLKLYGYVLQPFYPEIQKA